VYGRLLSADGATFCAAFAGIGVIGLALGLGALGSPARAANLARITTAPAKASGTATIGDRIWADVNHNGIQDPAETGMNGVTVRFVRGTQEVASTVTSNSPVDGSPGWYQLTGLPMGVTGKIVLDAVPNYLPGGSLVASVLTTPSAGNDPNLDSNGTQPGYGFVQIDPVTTGGSGPTSAAYDIGFSPAAALINQIWFDANSNGRHDPEEAGIDGVGVSIFDGVSNLLLGQTRSAADPTDPTRKGVCFFDGLPADRPWRIELNTPSDFAKGGPLNGLTLTQSHAPATTDLDDSSRFVPGPDSPRFVPGPDSDAVNIGGVATVSQVASAGNYSLNFAGDIGFRPLRKGEKPQSIKSITKPATPATFPVPTLPSGNRPTVSVPIISAPSSSAPTAPSITVVDAMSSSVPDVGLRATAPDNIGVSGSVEGDPETTATTLKERTQTRVIHDHSLILALTSDTDAPDSVAIQTIAPSTPVDQSGTAALPDAAATSAQLINQATMAQPSSPTKQNRSSLPVVAGGLVLLGVSGLLLARRFL
jgi:SdrD B-like domain